MLSLQDPKTSSSIKRLQGRMDSLRTQVRRYLAIDGASQGIAGLVAVSFLSLNLDFLFRLSFSTRIVQWMLFTGALAWWIWTRFVARLEMPLPGDELALAVERKYPELDCRLVSAMQFASAEPGSLGGASSELMAETVCQVDAQTEALDFGEVLNWERLTEWLAQVFVFVAICGFLSASSFYRFTDLEAGGVERSAVPVWFYRNVLLQNIDWPRSTRLKLNVRGLENGKVTVPAGASLEIDVEVEGVMPRQVIASWEAVDPDLDPMALQMARGQASFKKREGGRFFYLFEAIDASLKVEIHGGDALPQMLTVVVVRRPWVKDLQISASYPKHTGRKDEVFRGGMGDLALPEGSRIELSAQSSKRLNEAFAELRAPGEPVKKLWTEPMSLSNENQGFSIALVVTQTIVARIDVKDRDGLGFESPPRLSFRAIKDKAPQLQLKTSGIGNMVTPQVTIPLQMRARDDYGLSAGRLVHRATDPDPKKEGLSGFDEVQALSNGATEVELESPWEVNKLPLVPGMFLSFWLEATDNDELNKPKTGRSQVLNVRVVTREELMNDMIRRQQEQRKAFEDLIEIEKELDKNLAALPDKETAFREARKQLQVARRVGTISKELAKIVAEMGNNKILEDKDRERLLASIIVPMGQLEDQLLPESRRSFERLGDSQADAERIATQQGVQEIVRLMEAIKAQMIRLETLTELLTRLEKIIGDVDEMLDDIKGELGSEENKKPKPPGGQ